MTTLMLDENFDFKKEREVFQLAPKKTTTRPNFLRRLYEAILAKATKAGAGRK